MPLKLASSIWDLDWGWGSYQKLLGKNILKGENILLKLASSRDWVGDQRSCLAKEP